MFGSHLDVFRVGLADIRIYYVFVVISFLFMLYRFGKNWFSLFIVLLFFYGMFGFMGKNFQDLYKILVAAGAFIFLIRTRALQNRRKYLFTYITFGLFSVSFLTTSLINGDYFTITFSQYSRYFTILAVFLIFMKFKDDPRFQAPLQKVVFTLLTLQIVLTTIKFGVMGVTESIVGSINAQGGATATSLPILGFIFFWLKNKGSLRPKDWWYVIGLAFIGLVSAKRAIWFVMPIILAGFVFYVPKRKVPSGVVATAILLVPMLFYFGARLTPTLNPERMVWGSFDLDHIYTYSYEYMFGDGESSLAQGRGGATMMMFGKVVNGNINERDLLGHGSRFMYTTDYRQFYRLGFGIESKGSATGFFQNMISNGLVGTVSFILFAVSLILHTRNRRLRTVLFLFYFWEYFFYTGIILRDFALLTLLMYIVVMSGSTVVQTRTDAGPLLKPGGALS